MKAIFIDIDNTLLDFDAYVRESMRAGFARFGLRPYEPWMYDIFVRENDKLWQAIERSELTFARLQEIRWNTVFRALGIEADGIAFERYFREALHESAIPSPARMSCSSSCTGGFFSAPRATAHTRSRYTGWSFRTCGSISTTSSSRRKSACPSPRARSTTPPSRS